MGSCGGWKRSQSSLSLSPEKVKGSALGDYFVFLQVLQDGVGLPKLVEIFCNEGYNKQAKLHYLGPLLSNLTQLPEARKELLSQDR